MSENPESMNSLDGLTREQRRKLSELRPIYEKFYAHVPSFVPIWNDLALNEFARYPRNHPIDALCRYIDALQNACLQAAFAISRTKYFCIEEDDVSTIGNFSFYIQYYLYDLLTKVKTATDILALMIKHIFELNRLDKKYCALESGRICGALRENGGNQLKQDLARKLDRKRNDWIEPFYHLRNEVVHKTGLEFSSVGPNPYSESRFMINLRITSSLRFGTNLFNPIDDLKPLADEGDALSKFLVHIKSKSLAGYHGIDPIKFCDEIWQLLASLIDDIIKTCEPQIYDFIHAK
jgi:hypothetical protein